MLGGDLALIPFHLVTFIIFWRFFYGADIITAEYEYKATIALPHEPKQLLSCYDKQMIIYEWNGKLYALDFNDINDDDDLANFIEIPQNQQRFLLNSVSRS